MVPSAVIEIQQRYKANAFLDQINKELFMPRGLYALVLLYRSDDNTDTSPSQMQGVSVETIDLEHRKHIARWGTPSPSSKSTPIFRSIRQASGQTKGETMMPMEVAPLIYPNLDSTIQRQQSDPTNNESLKQRLNRNKKFIAQYYDRRHTADYTGNKPDTILTSAAPPTPFRSRLADPNHPVNNGSITALVSGGKYGHANPGSCKWRETGEDGRLKPINRIEDVKIRDVLGPISLTAYGIGWGLKGVRKVLGSDVMYLTIVNMPSEEELEEARKMIQENKKGLADLFRVRSR